MRLGIPIACALACGCAVLLWARVRGLVYLGRTSAGWTSVHDDVRTMGERIRVLDVAGTYQSATYLDERWTDPVFPYHRLFDHAFDAWPCDTGPSSAVVLGGGGYAVPKHLVAHHPELTAIDVVELDPAIEDIARRHFFLDRLEERYGAERGGRLRLHVADAHTWLEQSSQTYDLILNDCFFGIEPVASLMSFEATRMIHAHLSPSGRYLTNVVAALEGPGSTVLYQAIETLGSAFAHVWVYPCGADSPNTIENNVVIASDTWHAFEGAWEWPAAAKEH